jgi:hypothetical protein
VVHKNRYFYTPDNRDSNFIRYTRKIAMCAFPRYIVTALLLLKWKHEADGFADLIILQDTTHCTVVFTSDSHVPSSAGVGKF